MIGIGLLGFGYWGPNLTRNVSENLNCKLMAICELSEARRNAAAKRYPEVRIVSSPEEIFNAKDIDACIIATPVFTHVSLALAALNAGKHILVEKPLALTSGDAQRIIDLADSRGLTLVVGHTFMYHPAVSKLKELVADGNLGDIFSFNSVRTNLGLFKTDHNVLWDLAVHDLSILFSVVPSSVIAVSAVGSSHFLGLPEESAYLTLWLENSCLAHIHVSWFSPVKIRQTIVGGSQKMVVYDDLNNAEKIKIYDYGVISRPSNKERLKYELNYRSGDLTSPFIDNKEALAIEIGDFLSSIDSKNRPISNGEVSLRIIKVLEAADQSLRRKGMPLEIT